MSETHASTRRWRLLLGEDSEPGPQAAGADGQTGEMPSPGSELTTEDSERDRLLAYLYERGAERAADDEHDEPASDRSAGLGPSMPSPTTWLREVRRVFPQSVVDTLQQEAIDRYGLTELLTDPEVLRAANPSADLVSTLLSFRDQLSPEVMTEVRRIIRAVCDDLEQRLRQPIEMHARKRLVRHRHGGRRMLANLDLRRTIRHNLKHYDSERQVLVPERLFFHPRNGDQIPWELYILVDQSGSMGDSAIHSSVTAAIFHRLSAVRTRLFLFDTQVLDVSDQLDDPVATLLSFQMGGGTNIAGALEHVRDSISNPRRALVVVISDFCEGGDTQALIRAVRQLRESGSHLLGLAALSDRANTPEYDKGIGRRLEAEGMPIGAMTPDQLARWVGDRLT